MRGSPLVRFIFLVLALAATGVGLMRVTSTGGRVADPAAAPPVRQPLPPVSYRLVLSAAAESIAVETGKTTATADSGTLELDPANPYISLIVKWKSPPLADAHQFAKLTVAIPGQETFVHVFDAAGDIDDLVELPLPPATP